MIQIWFDFETTGTSMVNDKVIQMAAAAYDVNKKEVIEMFNTYVDPGVHIPSFITKLTGITDKDVVGAPSEEMAFRDLDKFFKKHNPDQICGHNIISFDLNWINYRVEKYGLEFNYLEKEHLDTLVYFRAVAKKGVLTGYDYKTRTGLVSARLEDIMSYFGLNEQTHQALDDVLNNLVVYQKLLELEKNDKSLGF